MEDQVTGPAPHRRRRMLHKHTRGERIKKFLEMPHLKRRERNQRIAIAGVLLLLAAYLALMGLKPLMQSLFGGRR